MNMMFALVFSAVVWSVAGKQLQLTYSHPSKTLILYQQNGDPVSITLSFQNKDLSLHQSLKDKPLFFSKQAKNPINNLNQLAKFDYKIKMALKSTTKNDIMGSVGLGEGGSLYLLLKQALNSSAAKIEVRHKDGVLRAVGQSCKYPIFLPLMLTLSQTNTHSYSIQKFSTNFAPDSSFLKVLNQAKSPFQITKNQIQQQLTVSLRDRVISIPLSDLVHCGKYSNSDNYECELHQSKDSDVAGLIFDFDPTFCGSAIEFQGEPQSAWGYHYSHLVLIGLQMALLVCLVRGQRVKSIMNSALELKFS